jgi:predicted nucleotidyltransferase
VFPGPEREQVDQLLALLRDVLGPDILGAYLHGSAALGGLRPRSDIDVLAVSRQRTTRAEKGRLVERLLTISGRTDPLGPPRPIELTIVVEAEVRPWRYPARFDFQYGEWLRGAFEAGTPSRGRRPPIPTLLP